MNLRLRYLLRERDERGMVQEQVLSVYRDLGVVPKADRDDNFNKTPEDLSNYKLVLPGDVVVNKMKAWQGSIAVSAYRGIVSGDYLVCEVVGQVDRGFLHHVLRSRPLIDQYAQRSTGIRPSQWRLYWEGLADIPLELPPLGVQQSISNYLDAETDRINTLVLKKRRLLQLLSERLTALTDSAVMDEPGAVRPIAALATYINGWPFKPGDFTTSGLPVIRIQQLTDPDAECDFYEGELPDWVRLRDGDLVFSWSGSLEVRMWNRGPAYLNQHLFRVVPHEGVDTQWLRYALDTSTRLFAGLIHGSAMTHITQPMMKDVRVPVPALNRQRVIAGMLREEWDRISKVQQLLERQIALFREHRHALIMGAIIREVAVPEVAV